MNWTKQAEEMSQAWVDAQKQMWEQWLNLAQNSPTAASDAFSQWQKTAKTMADQAAPTARATAERVLASQKVVMEFFQFATETWTDISAQVAQGGNWQETLGGYTEQFREQLTRSAEATYKLNLDSTELWQMYQAQLQKLAGPWQEWWQQAPATFTRLNGKSPMLSGLAGVYEQIYEQTFGPFLKSPTVGYNRELEHKMRIGFDVWQAYRQADFNYQLLLIEAWTKAFEQFQKRLVTLAQKGETVDTLEALGGEWIEAAESAFVEVFESQAYIEAQAELLNATMRYRIHQREMIEMVSKQLDIPTRTEVDEAHRANYQLRKEVKALKKELKVAGQNSAALTEAEQAIKSLGKELAAVNQANKKLTEGLEALKKEVAALKKSSSTTTKRTTTARKKSTPTKTRPTKAKEEGES